MWFHIFTTCAVASGHTPTGPKRDSDEFSVDLGWGLGGRGSSGKSKSSLYLDAQGRGSSGKSSYDFNDDRSIANGEAPRGSHESRASSEDHDEANFGGLGGGLNAAALSRLGAELSGKDKIDLLLGHKGQVSGSESSEQDLPSERASAGSSAGVSEDVMELESSDREVQLLPHPVAPNNGKPPLELPSPTVRVTRPDPAPRPESTIPVPATLPAPQKRPQSAPVARSDTGAGPFRSPCLTRSFVEIPQEERGICMPAQMCTDAHPGMKQRPGVCEDFSDPTNVCCVTEPPAEPRYREAWAEPIDRPAGSAIPDMHSRGLDTGAPWSGRGQPDLRAPMPSHGYRAGPMGIPPMGIPPMGMPPMHMHHPPMHHPPMHHPHLPPPMQMAPPAHLVDVESALRGLRPPDLREGLSRDLAMRVPPPSYGHSVPPQYRRGGPPAWAFHSGVKPGTHYHHPRHF